MKKRIAHLFVLEFTLFSVFFLLSSASIAQVGYEEGYFIDNYGIKTDCLIKNYEWKNSPVKIEYRLTESSETQTEFLENIMEFGVSRYKYQRFTVQIDQSPQTMATLGRTQDPVFAEQTVFLRLIVEGLANLYEYAKVKRYFFNVDGSEVEQLIYKNYLVEDRVVANNSFKTQLWENLKCEDITLSIIDQTNYNKRDLVSYFERFNACKGVTFKNYDKNKRKTDFNLSLKPGVRWSMLSITNAYNDYQNITFDGVLGYSIGLEAEIVIPINKNKWSAFVEPTYKPYKNEDPRENYSNDVVYNSIEIPVGVKYYLFLKKNSKIFLSAAFVFVDIPFNASIGTLEINSGNNLNFGAGYYLKDKFSIELRFGTGRDLLTNYAYYSSSYQTFSLILGYNFF